MCALRRFCISAAVFAAFAAAAPARAQEEELKPYTLTLVTVGIKGGFSSAHVAGEHVTASDPNNGFTGGVFFDFAVGSRAAFRPELLYSQKGSTPPDEFGGGSILSLGYLEVPLLLAISPGGERSRPYAAFGLVPAFEVGCELEEGSPIVVDDVPRSSGSDVQPTGDCDDPFPHRAFDLGLSVGGGIDFPAGAYRVRLDARYVAGLRSLSETADVKNRALAVTIGLARGAW